MLAKSLGNVATNGQTKNVTGEFNFDQLYNKWKFLRAVYSTAPSVNAASKVPDPKKAISNIKSTDSLTKKQTRLLSKAERKLLKKEKRDLRRNQMPEVGSATKAFAKLITSVKRVGVQYTETAGTTLPGYLDSTRVLGQNWNSRQPGLGFMLGNQPDTNWINQKGNKGLLTHDPIFNALIQQRFDQRLNLTAQINPIRDFNIDLNLDKSFNKNYSELYKDTSGFATGSLTRLNPYAVGSFSISYISYQTLFTKFDPNLVSETFKQFEANRILLSNKLGKQNPYNGTNPAPGADGFFEGYGRYAQDILIPSFLAAYTNKDPSSINLIKNSNPNLKAKPL